MSHGYQWWELALAVVAGVACGFLNTAASSGSAVSLPILMFIGLDPISANATNRIPVLLGAISAAVSFQAKRLLRWDLVRLTCVPVTIGSLLGAVLATLLPTRDLGLLITAAVLVALLLLFTRLKQVIEQAETRESHFSLREFSVFVLIGGWLGFIVLDGSTYLLLALTLLTGLELITANAVKSALLVPTTIVAMGVFAYAGALDLTLGAATGAGSIIGGVAGARLAASPASRRWVFRLLVTVIVLELVHLGIHYGRQTF